MSYGRLLHRISNSGMSACRVMPHVSKEARLSNRWGRDASVSVHRDAPCVVCRCATRRQPWLDHWLETCRDLSALRAGAPDDGRGHRRDRRPHDPRRRPVAGGLRLLQLPRLRSRPRRSSTRCPAYLERWGTHPSWSRLLGSPRALRGDRGAADRAARLRGHARAADDHPHPHVGDPDARGLGHDLPGLARAQDDLRRLPGRPLARRGGHALPLRGPRAPRRAAARPSATARAWSAWTASTA